MTNEELKIMILSETVRNYVLETGWTFTDMEKAALLYHSDLPLSEQYSRLRDLRDKTADDDLRRQIAEYLDREDRAMLAFKENSGKQCIYILKTEEKGGFWDGKYLPNGYFFDRESAFEYGKKEKAKFKIEKRDNDSL